MRDGQNRKRRENRLAEILGIAALVVLTVVAVPYLTDYLTAANADSETSKALELCGHARNPRSVPGVAIQTGDRKSRMNTFSMEDF